jgi:hypothetical protein
MKERVITFIRSEHRFDADGKEYRVLIDARGGMVIEDVFARQVIYKGPGKIFIPGSEVVGLVECAMLHLFLEQSSHK